MAEKKKIRKNPPQKYVEMGAKKPEHYADPQNWRYPIYATDPEKRKKIIRAAISYLAKPHNAAFYKPDELKKVWRRIIAAAQKNGIEVSDEIKKRAGVKVKKSMLEGYRAVPPMFRKDLSGFTGEVRPVQLQQLSDEDLAFIIAADTGDEIAGYIRDWVRYEWPRLELDARQAGEPIPNVSLIRAFALEEKEWISRAMRHVVNKGAAVELIARIGATDFLAMVIDFIYGRIADMLSDYGLGFLVGLESPPGDETLI